MNREKAKRFLKKYILLRMLIWLFYNTIFGLFVYYTIRRKYINKYKIFIEHYPGTGDVFLTCGFLEAFTKKSGVNKNYVLTVIGSGAYKMAKLYRIENVIKLTQHQSDALIHLGRLIGFNKINIEVLHYHPMAMHNGIIDNLMSYKGLNFMDMYLACVFPNLKLEDFRYPIKPYNRQYIEDFCEVNGLEGKNIILLCPHANTIDPISWKFWCILAELLKDNNFEVCTNASDNEPIIPNTTRVFLPYEYMNSFVDKCRYCIGLRSGLFDFISATDSNLIVLYPKTNFYKFGVGSLYDYFSLHKMGLSSKAIEIEFYRDEEIELLEKILSICTGNDLRNRIINKYNNVF